MLETKPDFRIILRLENAGQTAPVIGHEHVPRASVESAPRHSLHVRPGQERPLKETRTLSLQQGVNLLLQLGQIIFDGGPDDLQIDEEILMDRHVAHSAHLRPWKLGMLFEEVRRDAVDLVHGLANDLYIAATAS